MTVWTNVTLNEINEWLAARGMQSATEILPIEDGVEDTVYRLDFIDNTSSCLRLYERTEPKGPLTIAALLAEEGLPTCPPTKGIGGNVLRDLNGKPACLFPWIEGAWEPNPSLEQIEEIGHFLGGMAKASQKESFDWHRKNPRGTEWFEKTILMVLPFLSKEEQTELQNEWATQKLFWKSEISQVAIRGPIHADLFRDNVMFGHDGRLAAVIDWGFCAGDEPLIYDLAITANSWCLAEDDCTLDPIKLEALISSREKESPLTDADKACWPMALRLGGLRFYLSRLHDRHFPRDPDGKIYPPEVFLNILRNRKETKQRWN